MHKDRAVLIVNDVCNPLNNLIKEFGKVLWRCVHDFEFLVSEILREYWFHTTHRLQNMSNTILLQFSKVLSSFDVADKQPRNNFLNSHDKLIFKIDFIPFYFISK